MAPPAEPRCTSVAPAGIDPSMAAAVGEWYLATPSTPRQEQVVAAYEDLQTETDRLFAALGRADGPRAVRLAFTRSRQPYGGAHDLMAAVREERTLEITTAAAEAGRLHPLLGCEFGGAFDRFRAVHDLIGHARLGYGFDLDGECAAWLAQDRGHRGLARAALATELCGVNCARSVIGEAPDLKAMLMAPHVLQQLRVSLREPVSSLRRSSSAPAGRPG